MFETDEEPFRVNKGMPHACHGQSHFLRDFILFPPRFSRVLPTLLHRHDRAMHPMEERACRLFTMSRAYDDQTK